MIQTTNDVYNLILNQKYSMKYEHDLSYSRTRVLTDGTLGNRVEVKKTKTTMDIYVFQNGNSQYYEHLPRRNGAYIRIQEALFAKELAAMVADVNENYR